MKMEKFNSQSWTVKNLPAVQETQVQSLSEADPLEKGMATHSSMLPERIPWTEEPGGLQSMGLQRVGHEWATELNWTKDFPSDPVVKNPPANAGDIGSIPGPGGSYMPWSN